MYEETGQSLDQLFGRLVCADVFSEPSVGTPQRRNNSLAAKMRAFPARRPADQVGVRTPVPVRAIREHAVRVQRADLSRLQMLSPAQILQQGMTALPLDVRDALKLLVHEAVDYDGAGARIKVLEDSPRYREYLVHRLRYESAALRFMAGYLSQRARQAAARQDWSAQGRGQERELGKLNLAYLHIMEAMEGDLKHGKEINPAYEAIPVSFFRPLFKGTLEPLRFLGY